MQKRMDWNDQFMTKYIGLRCLIVEKQPFEYFVQLHPLLCCASADHITITEPGNRGASHLREQVLESHRWVLSFGSFVVEFQRRRAYYQVG